MSRAGRWSWVGSGVLLLVAVPLLLHARPAPASEISASALLARIEQSDVVPFSGYAQSVGRVSLPSEEALSSVAKLLGGTSSVRVWWAGPGEWRTATLRPTGETGHWHHDGRLVRWVYESKRVTVSPDVPVRLPISVDVLPNVLAGRILEDARPEELSRIGSARIAGRTAYGLRLTPADAQSSIGHADVWADSATGVPLRVELTASEDGSVALSSSMLEVSFEPPADEVLRFMSPPDAEVSFDDTVDLAAAADRYAERDIPATLAGLPARAAGVRSVGVYGRGPTLLLALPLRDSDAEQFRDELSKRPGAECLEEGWVVGTGPLQLLVTSPSEGGSWLVAGTVTRDAATDAASELLGGHFFFKDCP
jgi:outer membrane lipoprotein-sorting protein